MYRYETHVHTSETSACGRVPGAKVADYYKKAGYDGVFVSDHFFNGNTTVPRDLPWRERVDLFCRGYDEVKRRGDEIGLDVFFAWEYSFKGTDWLTYGLDKNWLYEHPECVEINFNDYCDLVHNYGGIVVQAHPFREADYIAMIRIVPWKIDAVEVMNAARRDIENERAEWMAQSYNLPRTAGSDFHRWQSRLSGMDFEERIGDAKDIVDLILREKSRIFVIDEPPAFDE